MMHRKIPNKEKRINVTIEESIHFKLKRLSLHYRKPLLAIVRDLVNKEADKVLGDKI